MISEHSDLLSRTLGFLYPFILLTGLYTTLNGHVSPGGGFQGGALLASIFVCRFLVIPTKEVCLFRVQFIEKITLLFIFSVAMSFALLSLQQNIHWLAPYYFYLLNALIGLKVACGMTIVFYRFVFYESK